MAEAVMVVLAAAQPGQAEELDQWYETRHVKDLMAVPGFKSIARYDLRAMKIPEGCPQWDFLGLYQLEADDINAVLAESGKRMGTAQMPASPAMDSAKTLAFVAFPKSAT